MFNPSLTIKAAREKARNLPEIQKNRIRADVAKMEKMTREGSQATGCSICGPTSFLLENCFDKRKKSEAWINPSELLKLIDIPVN